jgi:hypothetical protein
MIREYGRLYQIHPNGDMEFVNGQIVPLPWKKKQQDTKEDEDDDETTGTVFVHCSAGAFHYTKQRENGEQQPLSRRRVFEGGHIVIQDMYGTPGFCFNGSFLGFLESLGDKLTEEQKNDLADIGGDGDGGYDDDNDDDGTVAAMGRMKRLGPSNGDVNMSLLKGYVKRLSNVRKWIRVPEVRQWLVTKNRLFNLGHWTEQELISFVDETYTMCQQVHLV